MVIPLQNDLKQMENREDATKTDAQTVATEEIAKVTLPTQNDPEAQIKALEDEKARLIADNANYKLALLKKEKKGEVFDPDETDEDKMRRIANETLQNSRIAEIAREQELIIQKALKENKELKLAQLNKGNVPMSVGSSNEGQPVKDTTITPEQSAAFKAKGWSDKDIERYKRNLQRYAR